MANYYNKTNGPIAVTLSSGKVVLIPRKSWYTIEPRDDGNPSIQQSLNNGDLILGRPSIPVVVASVMKAIPSAVSEPVAQPVAPAVRSGKKGR